MGDHGAAMLDVSLLFAVLMTLCAVENPRDAVKTLMLLALGMVVGGVAVYVTVGLIAAGIIR